MTDTRPLPVDLASLKAWLPAEPPDTEPARYRRAVNRLDHAVVAVAADLELLDRHDRDLALAVVDFALGDRPIDLSTVAPGDRALLDHQLAVLRQARSTAQHRMAAAEHSDETYLAWKRMCKAMSDEWQRTQAGETPEARFVAVLDFAARHEPQAEGD